MHLGFADVVQQRGHTQDRIGITRIQARHRVVPHVVRVSFVLCTSDGGDEFWAGDFDDSRATHDLERNARTARAHRLEPLVTDTLGAHTAKGPVRARFAHGTFGIGIDGAIERCGKPCAAKDAQAILGKTFARVTDGANEMSREIRATTKRIDDVAIDGIERDGVDGEVTAGKVCDDVLDKLDRVRAAAVGIGAFAAQCCEFVVYVAQNDGDGAVLQSGRDDLVKDAHDLLGPRIGSDIPVFGRLSPQEIAHASANDPTASSVFTEAATNAEDVFGDEVDEVSDVGHADWVYHLFAADGDVQGGGLGLPGCGPYRSTTSL